MQRTLFVANCDVLAHASRALVIAQALRERFSGSILCAGHGKYATLFSDAGFRFYELAGISPRIQEDLAQHRWRLLDREWVNHCCCCFRQMIDSELELYRALKPDLVVMDARMSVLVSTEAFGVPCIRIVNAAMLLTPSVIESGIARKTFAMTVGIPMLELIPGTLLRAFAAVGSRLAHFILLRLLNKFRVEYHLKPLRGLSDLPFRAIILPDLEPMAPIKDLPSNSHYVGPVIWQPPVEMPKELQDLEDIVYVSMGSTGNPEIFKLLIAALRLLPEIRSVITVGDLVDPETLNAFPSNVRVYRFLPGIEMLKRTRLLICHGGLGTIYQALSQGVPVLGIPFMIFHEAPALDRIEELGLGRKLDGAKLTPEKVAHKIREMLNNESYRKAAQAAAGQIRLNDAPEKAATIILKELEELSRQRWDKKNPDN